MGAMKRTIRTMKQYGMPVPEKLKRSVHPQPWMIRYLNIFEDLTFDRPVGMTTGHIPVMSIFNYCDRHGWPEDDIQDVIYFVRILDVEFLEWCRRQSESKKTSS